MVTAPSFRTDKFWGNFINESGTHFYLPPTREILLAISVECSEINHSTIMLFYSGFRLDNVNVFETFLFLFRLLFVLPDVALVADVA